MSREGGRVTSGALERFETAMDNDLNTSAALAALFDLVKGGNTILSSSNK